MNSLDLSGDYTVDIEHVKTVGRYQIVCKLGQGATGTVLLAWDPFIKRNVALKLAQGGTDRYRQRFLSEAQSAGKLNHPNIVAVYDAGIQGELCYIAMEYIKGATLANWTRKGSLLKPQKGVEILLDVCKGLDYAHREGIIHRDIKPSNILLNEEGTAKITDFGTAQMVDRTFNLGICGTPHYLSPEQVREEIISFQSDIFSLGCVLYEILTGEKAFPGENSYGVCYKITTVEPVCVLTLREGLPRVLEEITRRALRKDPRERYQSCMEMAYDLTVALRGAEAAPPRQGNIRDVVDYLHHLSFFADFSTEQLGELTKLASVIRVRAGRVIAGEGDIDDNFYIILSGQSVVRKHGVELAKIGSGECFGEMAFIGGQPRVANVLADTDCILMKISAGLLQRLPDSIGLLFFRSFARTLVRRLSTSIERKD